jgi:hypothetical protein
LSGAGPRPRLPLRSEDLVEVFHDLKSIGVGQGSAAPLVRQAPHAPAGRIQQAGPQ